MQYTIDWMEQQSTVNAQQTHTHDGLGNPLAGDYQYEESDEERMTDSVQSHQRDSVIVINRYAKKPAPAQHPTVPQPLGQLMHQPAEYATPYG